jgi:hypothetical protein
MGHDLSRIVDKLHPLSPKGRLEALHTLLEDERVSVENSWRISSVKLILYERSIIRDLTKQGARLRATKITASLARFEFCRRDVVTKFSNPSSTQMAIILGNQSSVVPGLVITIHIFLVWPSVIAFFLLKRWFFEVRRGDPALTRCSLG